MKITETVHAASASLVMLVASSYHLNITFEAGALAPSSARSAMVAT